MCTTTESSCTRSRRRGGERILKGARTASVIAKSTTGRSSPMWMSSRNRSTAPPKTATRAIRTCGDSSSTLIRGRCSRPTSSLWRPRFAIHAASSPSGNWAWITSVTPTPSPRRPSPIIVRSMDGWHPCRPREPSTRPRAPSTGCPTRGATRSTKNARVSPPARMLSTRSPPRPPRTSSSAFRRRLPRNSGGVRPSYRPRRSTAWYVNSHDWCCNTTK